MDPNPCFPSAKTARSQRTGLRSLARVAGLVVAGIAALAAPYVVSALDPSTSTTISSATPTNFRSPVTFTVRVAAPTGSPTPTGSVTLRDGVTSIGSCILVTGSCTVTTSTLAVGAHGINAAYAGDAAHDPSVSPTIIQTVLSSARGASAAGSGGSVTALAIPAPTPASTGDLLVAAITVTGGSGVTINAPAGWARIGTDVISTTLLKQGLFWKSATSGDLTVASTWTVSASQRVSGVVMAIGGATVGAPLAAGQANASSTVIATPVLSLGSARTGVALLFGGSAIGTSVSSVGAGYTRAASASASGGKASSQTTSVGAYAASGTTASVAASSITLGAAAVNIGHTVFVPQATPSSATRLSSASATITFGQTLALSTRVDPTSATGAVTVFDGTAVLGSCTLAGGVCTVNGVGLSAGAHSLSASYAGGATALGSTSVPVAATVTPAASRTTLASSANPAPYGSPVTFTATVATSDGSVASGTVTFTDNGAPLGSCGLSGGACSVSSSALTIGNHMIVATFGGDANHTGSSSAMLGQQVSLASSTTTLTSDVNPSIVGSMVVFTASVTSPVGTPEGSVTLSENGSVIGACTLYGGVCQVGMTGLSLGTHTIVATYSGDATRAGSVSAGYAQFVSKILSSTVVSSALNPSTFGSPVAFAIAVSTSDYVTATGTVSLSDGTLGLGRCSLSTGTCTVTVASLSVGDHAITARYSGDAGHQPSVSSVLTQTVAQASTTTTLTSSPNPSTFGGTVTMTATVTSAGGTPTGVVSLSDGSVTLGTCTLGTPSAGSCTFTTTALAVGTHSLTAYYTGDASRAPSLSAVRTQTVSTLATSTTVTSSANPANYGVSVTFTAVVSTASATGTVSFSDGTTPIGTCQLASGRCTFATSGLLPGVHPITARYGGDAVYAGSVSAAVNQTVNKLASSTSLTASPTSIAYGSTVTMTATVSPSTATGTVTFVDGATGPTVATCTLASGTCSATTTTLTVGSHSLIARYGGDATELTSGSNAVSVSVAKANSTLLVSSGLNPAGLLNTVRFTATVSPGAAGGTVTFADNGTSIGTCTLVSGTCVFATSALAIGTHPISATYSGDANLNGSSFSGLSQVVTIGSTVTVASSAPSSAYGAGVSFTASVSTLDGVAATGTMTILDGTTGVGTCTLSGSPTASCVATVTTLAVGPHSISARFNGDSGHAANSSAAISQSITAATASIAIAGTPNPSTFGGSVTFTLTVTTSDGGPATGTASLSEAGVTIGTCTLSSSRCSLFTSALTGGTHTLVAAYGGDANHSGATSAAYTQTVAAAATTTTVATSAATVNFGSLVTFTATVAPAAASGTVTVLDGSVPVGTCTLSSGSCTVSTSALAGGNHSITASYGGSPNYATSTSAALTQTVSRVASTLVLAGGGTTTSYGTAVTFTATVSPSTATGSVAFSDGTTPLGTCTLGTAGAGACTFSVSTLAAGTHSITARYAGDTNFLSSSAGPVAQTVVAVGSTVTLTTNANPTVIGTGTATITVAPNGPTGTVTLLDGTTPVDSCTLASSLCTISLARLGVGTHVLTASYAGDTNHASGVSASLSQVVVIGAKSASSAGNGGATTLVVAAPAGLTTGDVVVAAVTAASSSVTISTPAGWTRLAADVTSATAALRQSLFWKAITSGDTAASTTWTFSASVKASGVIVAVGGAALTAPAAVAGAAVAASTTIATPTLSLGSSRTGVALIFAGVASGTTLSSAGSGYTTPGSGGSAASTGGSTGSRTTTGSAYGTVVTTTSISASSLTFAASAAGIGHAVFLDQLIP